VVFDVKGLLHPEGKIIAFPRFIPTPQGTRQGTDATYGKIYSLDERFKYLQQNYPELIVFDSVFGETMCEVSELKLEQVHDALSYYYENREAIDRKIKEDKEFTKK